MSCSWKQQPDKAQIEMSVPCSAFLRSEAAVSIYGIECGGNIKHYRTNHGTGRTCYARALGENAGSCGGIWLCQKMSI